MNSFTRRNVWAGRRSGILAILTMLVVTTGATFVSTPAQDDPPELAPPPVKVIPPLIAKALDAEKDIGDRTKMIVKQLGLTLAGAEKAHSGSDHDGMFRDLGIFEALVDNSLDFLDGRNDGRGKVLDNYKRVEIALRGFIPRLETLRREVPLRYEDYVRNLIKYVRDARTRATEPLFSNTVVRTRTSE